MNQRGPSIAHGFARRHGVRRMMVGLAVLVAFTTGACGGDDDQLTGDRLAEELELSDIPADVAACIADELPDGLSRSAIEQRDDAEAEKFLTAATTCSEKLGPSGPDASIPDISDPDVSIPEGSVPEDDAPPTTVGGEG